ncbi:hypothetical protein L6164_002799 [Bauhinia variegata]|uniref:Uncharacterized protein n=1 Tax=Bauhinia variegata TaxID=167791 RepID=A0ACB9PZA5_BAUVA|nr:hypothetical protein L6164_002799 [Bauhinia variegata]
MSTNRLWVSFLIIVLVEGWLSECCWYEERDALLHLKAQFDLPSDWVDGSHCCLWKNVECNNTTRRVSKLTLSARYRGSSDFHVHLSDFHAFKALESLDLSYNNIAGFVQNKGNERLSWPSSLEVLDLSYNSLRNDTVSSFSELKCLKQLNLSGNILEGSLNISGDERLSWPSSLEVLDLSYNSVCNDTVSSFSDLKCLKQLNLSGNILEGSLNISGNERLWPSSLEVLDLGYNSLRNDAVSSFSDLKCLKQRKLSLNMLEGSLNNGGGKHYIDIVLPLTTFFIILFVGASLVYCCANKKVRLEKIAEKNGDLFSIWNYDGKIAFEDIIQATEDFDLKYCIGTGGYGSVYRAMLPMGRIVALKKLHRMESQNPRFAQSFQNEIKMLTKVRH